MAEEDWEDYVPGGYHPITIGDEFSDGRYAVVRKLGWGHFSTVWLARDTVRNKHVALKVVKSADRYTETAVDEIKLLQRINNADPRHPGEQYLSSLEPGRTHVISLLDQFRHSGPNGIHVCMVFEVLGENLLGLLKRYRHGTFPVSLVKQIAAQILLGLEYMHDKCGIIHTDLKPENILICIDDVEAVVADELAKSPSSTPNFIGVPPSKGRGGNQTPRSDSISIVASQPLPSPSSAGTSPFLGKWAFGMSSISDRSSPPITQDHHADRSNTPPHDVVVKVMENVRLDSPIGKKTVTLNRPPGGPSLLSQQAPHDNPGKSTISHGSPTATRKPLPPMISTSNHRAPIPDGDSIGQDGSPSSDVENIRVMIADLGNATWTDHHFTDDIQTRQYRSPEVILGAAWGPSADLWSAACVIFELLTGGDYLFDPAMASRYGKDDDHLAQVMELMGEFPKEFALSGKHSKEFFDENGKLKRISKLRFWSLEAVLIDKYLFPQEEAAEIASFLNPMLHVCPDKRAHASSLIRHPWLTSRQPSAPSTPRGSRQ
ncbi:kinase-like protein [Sistotremastrum suecicum HHB10207 ss-3]|uniref:non-specific serine/threonine protein kinase n=1 Tax=Sistotremastrum suecicum HHB10207 ss-3 TaxID=1314776 RepID=A0A166JE37_9AGAM|nr:kinase-like protein [Sistotremastrum suecicum HHB10207 ss-3]